MLSRVIEWSRDGITIEADQRRVREILKDFEQERACHSATPCALGRKHEVNARSDGSNGENRCEQGQNSTQARVGRHVTVTAGTDCRWQVPTPMTARHSQVVTSRSTEHLLHESVACHKTDQTLLHAHFSAHSARSHILHIFIRVHIHAWLKLKSCQKGVCCTSIIRLHLAFSISCFTSLCCSCTSTSTSPCSPPSCRTFPS